MEIMVAKINDEYLSKYCEKCVVDKSGEDSLVLDGIWGIWGIWFRVCVAEGEQEFRPTDFGPVDARPL